MSISKDAATAALAEIEAATVRSRELTGYAIGGPYLILWGIVWVVASGLTHFMAGAAAVIWNSATAIGFAATLWMILATSATPSDAAATRRRRAIAAKVVATVVALNLFAWITMWLIEPQAAQYSLTFFGLMVAAIYLVMGIWMGLRYALAGLAVATAMIIGKLYVASMFSLWFAVFCGGSLIVCGFWLKRA